jgi:hypothetical protein
MNRYSLSERFYIKEDGKSNVAPLKIYNIPETSNDKWRQVKSDEQFAPDLISYREYGDETLYWIILMANNIFDPFTELSAGKLIRIPSKYYIDIITSAI